MTAEQAETALAADRAAEFFHRLIERGVPISVSTHMATAWITGKLMRGATITVKGQPDPPEDWQT